MTRAAMIKILAASALALLSGCSRESPELMERMAQRGKVAHVECIGLDKAFTTRGGAVFVAVNHRDCVK